MRPFYEVYPGFKTAPTGISVIHNQRELYFAPHIHSNLEILYVYSGTQHMYIEDNHYKIREGEAVVIFPEFVHGYYKDEERYADEILLNCDMKIFGGAFPDITDCCPEDPVVSVDKIDDNTKEAFKRINKDDVFTVKLGWMYIILSCLFENLALGNRDKTPVYDITYELMNYIKDNFTENITLDSLSERFHLSKYYISRIFSDRIKMSFRSYIGLIRSERAAKLIRTTDDTLTKISSDSGFDSQRTFNRVFKSVHGLTPSEYRHKTNRESKA